METLKVIAGILSMVILSGLFYTIIELAKKALYGDTLTGAREVTEIK